MRVREVLNRTNVIDEVGELIVDKGKILVSLNGSEMTGRFHLVESAVDGIILIPFAIRRHEKISRVDLKDAC